MRYFGPLLLLSLIGGCATSPDRATEAGLTSTNTQAAVQEQDDSGDLKGTRVVIASMASGKEGVYYFHNGFSTLILELCGGRFRYWFRSDVSGAVEPTYPVTGTYTADGARVRLHHRERFLQDEWTFRRVNGQITLWRPTAIQWWREKRAWDYFGVLYSAEAKPDELWARPVERIGP